MHILSNISQGNQKMKFGQLTEYNMRNIFLEKSYTKCSGETIPRPFSKKSKLSISLDQQSKVLYSLFLLCAKSKVYQNILKLSCRPLTFISYKTFLKKQIQSPCLIFCMIFERKYFSSYVLLTDFVNCWEMCVL